MRSCFLPPVSSCLLLPVDCIRPFHTGPQALAGVLDDHEAVSLRQFHDPRHIGHVAAEMDGNYGLDPSSATPGFRRQQFLNPVAVDVEILPHIHQDRPGADIDHRRSRGHKGMGRHDHRVAGADPRRPQGHVEGVIAAVQTHGVFRTHEGREIFLEPFQLPPVDQIALAHDFEISGIQLFLDHPVKLRRLHKLHFSIHSITSCLLLFFIG